MSGGFPPKTFIPHNKTAGSGEESAVTFLATRGCLRVSHERATVRITRRRSFEHGADRMMARYEINPARRAARTMRGASCERRRATMTCRGRRHASEASSIGRAEMRPFPPGMSAIDQAKPRVSRKRGHAIELSVVRAPGGATTPGEAVATRGRVRARLRSSCASTRLRERTPTVRPASGTSVPPAWPREGLVISDDFISARRSGRNYGRPSRRVFSRRRELYRVS